MAVKDQNQAAGEENGTGGDWPAGISGQGLCVLVGHAPAALEVKVPTGWQCERLGSNRLRLFCAGPVADRNPIAVLVDGVPVAFTMLGPGEARGYEAGANVPAVPRVRGSLLL